MLELLEKAKELMQTLSHDNHLGFLPHIRITVLENDNTVDVGIFDNFYSVNGKFFITAVELAAHIKEITQEADNAKFGYTARTTHLLKVADRYDKEQGINS